MPELEEKNKNRKEMCEIESQHQLMIYNSNIWKIYLFHLLMGFHLIAGILVPFFLTWGKLTFVEIMLLQGYFTIMVLAFEIPCGAIADHLSRKFSLFLGGLSTALAVLIYSITPYIFLFIIGETLWAFGEALISGTNSAFIFDTLKKLGKEEEMSKKMARNQGFFLVGICFAAPLGSLLTIYLPIQIVVRLMFLPFIGASLTSIALKEPNHDMERTSEKYLKIVKSGFKELKQNRILRIMAIDYVIIEALMFFIIWTYQLYLEDLRVPLFYFGFVAAFMTLIQLICVNLIPKVEKNISNKHRFLIIYSTIPGIGFILLAVILFPPISIIILLILVGIGFSRNVLFINGINKNIETENRATVLSTINMIICLIRAIIYPIIGLLVMWNLRYTFVILGIIIIILALLTQTKNNYL